MNVNRVTMTCVAFILGVLPLAISTGADSASRQSIGIRVISGILAATALAIIFVPLFVFSDGDARETRRRRLGANAADVIDRQTKFRRSLDHGRQQASRARDTTSIKKPLKWRRDHKGSAVSHLA